MKKAAIILGAVAAGATLIAILVTVVGFLASLLKGLLIGGLVVFLVYKAVGAVVKLVTGKPLRPIFNKNI